MLCEKLFVRARSLNAARSTAARRSPWSMVKKAQRKSLKSFDCEKSTQAIVANRDGRPIALSMLPT